jgi:hypothetical protein
MILKDLHGVYRKKDVVVVAGDGPGLATAAHRLGDRWPIIGVNHSHYAVPVSVLVTSYPRLVAMAWLNHVPVVVRMKMGGRPGTVWLPSNGFTRCVPVCKRRFGEGNPYKVPPEPDTLQTHKNVGLAATHLALITGARKILFVGFDQQSMCHWYHLDGQQDRVRRLLDHMRQAISRWPREVNRNPAKTDRFIDMMEQRETLKDMDFGTPSPLSKEMRKHLFSLAISQVLSQGVRAYTLDDGIMVESGATRVSYEEVESW